MTTVLALAALAFREPSHDIADYVQGGLRDAAFTWKVVRRDEAAMAKINRDFGQAYRFGQTSVRLKEPYLLRIDANVEDTVLSYVVNGTTQAFKLPRLGINKKSDLARQPGKRQTAMDFGVLTPSLLVDLLDARFVEADEATGAAVFDLTYKPALEDATRYRVWLDPKSRTMARREWFGREGRRMATFVYAPPTTQAGASIPSGLTIQNGEGQEAAVSRFEAVRLNAGIADEVFRL